MGKKIKGLTVEVNGNTTGFRKALNEAKQDATSFSKAITNINQAIKLDPTNAELYASKQNLLNEAIQKTQTELKNLDELKRAMEKDPELKSTKEYSELELQIAKASDQLKKYREQQTALSAETQVLQAHLRNVSESFDKISQKTKIMSAAATAAITASTKSAMSYETGIANIEKVTGELSEEIKQDLKDIARNTATEFDGAFSKISEYAAMGATLGIASKDLAVFAETMRNLEVSTDGAISGEEGAKMVSRLLNVFHVGAEYAGNLGSAITYVGDQFSATGDEILETASRMSGLSVINGITQNDLIGLAAEMKNLGIETESGASAISKTFLSIDKNVASSGKELEHFASTAGMSSEQFQKAWKEDAVDAFLAFTDGLKSNVFREIQGYIDTSSSKISEFAEVLGMSAEEFKKAWGEDANSVFEQYIEGLGELSEESTSASVILSDVKLSGVRVSQTLLKLAGNSGTVKKAISDTNKAWEENTALTEKTNHVYETTASQLAQMWEAVKQAGAELGKVFLPIIKKTAEKISDFAKAFSKSDDSTKKFTATALTMVAAISPVSKIVSKTTDTVSSGITAWGKFKDSMSKVESVNRIMSSGFGTLTSVIGIGLVGALAAGMASLALYVLAGGNTKRANDEIIESFENQRKELKELNDTAANNYFVQSSQMDYAVNYAQSIDEIVRKLKDENITVEESTRLKEDLGRKIDTYNKLMGDSAIAFDEEKNTLIHNGEAVGDLTSLYKDLIEEQKRSAWIAANTQAYQVAIQTINESTSQIQQAQQNFANDTAGVSKEVQQYYWDMMNGVSGAGKAWIDYMGNDKGLAGEMNTYREAVTRLSGAMDSAKETTAEAYQVVNTFNQVTNASTEEWSQFAEMANLGIDCNSTLEQLTTMRNEIQNSLNTYDTLVQMGQAGLVDENAHQRDLEKLHMIDGLIDQIAKNSGEKMTNSAQKASENRYRSYKNSLQSEETLASETEGRIQNNSLEHSKKTADLRKEDWQKLSEDVEGISSETAESVGGLFEKKGETSSSEFWKLFKSKFDEIVNYWKEQDLNKTATITVNYKEANSPSSFASQISGSLGQKNPIRRSSPLRMARMEDPVMALADSEDTVLGAIPSYSMENTDTERATLTNHLLNSLSTMRQSLAFASNTGRNNSQSSSNTINLSFTVNNNGKEMTQSDLKRYGNLLVSILDDKLGRKI